MKVCQHCQLYFDDKYQFCDKCGGKLQEKIDMVFCPYCGNKVETKGKYCPFCGEILVDAEPVHVAQSPIGFENDKPIKVATQSDIKVSQQQRTIQRQVSSQTKSYKNQNVHNSSPSIKKDDSSFSSRLGSVLAGAVGLITFLVIVTFLKGAVLEAIRKGYGLVIVILAIVLVAICINLGNRNKK